MAVLETRLFQDLWANSTGRKTTCTRSLALLPTGTESLNMTQLTQDVGRRAWSLPVNSRLEGSCSEPLRVMTGTSDSVFPAGSNLQLRKGQVPLGVQTRS